MHLITIQRAEKRAFSPTSTSLKQWAKCALAKKVEAGEITIRIVDEAEMTSLNSTFRHKAYPTNVLSFPFTMPDTIEMDVPLLGDIVICAAVVNKEAKEQQKPQEAHWAHMVVHGVFHLLGYDHETDSDAEVMESLEIETLQALGFTNPYEIGDNIKNYD